MYLLLTVEAMYDVADIADHIAASFGEDRALQFQIDIERQFERLGAYPHEKTGINYRDYPIYKAIFQPSLIFFVIIGDSIHVLRVLREERDWGKIIKGNQSYDYL